MRLILIKQEENETESQEVAKNFSYVAKAARRRGEFSKKAEHRRLAGHPSLATIRDLTVMIEFFYKGGPIMWPILLTSIIAVTVVIDRLFFVVRERLRRDPRVVREVLGKVENGDYAGAARLGEASKDFVARTLTYALTHRDKSVSDALLRAAAWELKRFNRGISILDTVITLAPPLVCWKCYGHDPLLVFGGGDRSSQAIAVGIAEALIATASGLAVAILALLPFNYMNAQLEEARNDIQDAATHLELHLTHRRWAKPSRTTSWLRHEHSVAQRRTQSANRDHPADRYHFLFFSRPSS
jgi:biopolymer transport protein ExbB